MRVKLAFGELPAYARTIFFSLLSSRDYQCRVCIPGLEKACPFKIAAQTTTSLSHRGVCKWMEPTSPGTDRRDLAMAIGRPARVKGLFSHLQAHA